jgi:uncharacterized membrane protein
MMMTTDTAARARSRRTLTERRQQSQDRPGDPANVGTAERWGSVIGGGLIAWSGVRHGGLFGAALLGVGALMIQRGATGHCPGYSALGIDTAKPSPPPPHEYFDNGIQVVQVMTIDKSPHELYTFWRQFQNLPRFMRHLQSVTVHDPRHSHWVACGPAGSTVQGDAEIINDQPDRLIAWRSLADADVDNAGSVRFVSAPSGRGTQVHVNIQYLPPAGRLGAAIATLFGSNPRQEIQEDLYRFKQLMEPAKAPTTREHSAPQSSGISVT